MFLAPNSSLPSLMKMVCFFFPDLFRDFRLLWLYISSCDKSSDSKLLMELREWAIFYPRVSWLLGFLLNLASQIWCQSRFSQFYPTINNYHAIKTCLSMSLFTSRSVLSFLIAAVSLPLSAQQNNPIYNLHQARIMT